MPDIQKDKRDAAFAKLPPEVRRYIDNDGMINPNDRLPGWFIGIISVMSLNDDELMRARIKGHPVMKAYVENGGTIPAPKNSSVLFASDPVVAAPSVSSPPPPASTPPAYSAPLSGYAPPPAPPDPGYWTQHEDRPARRSSGIKLVGLLIAGLIVAVVFVWVTDGSFRNRISYGWDSLSSSATQNAPARAIPGYSLGNAFWASEGQNPRSGVDYPEGNPPGSYTWAETADGRWYATLPTALSSPGASSAPAESPQPSSGSGADTAGQSPVPTPYQPTPPPDTSNLASCPTVEAISVKLTGSAFALVPEGEPPAEWCLYETKDNLVNSIHCLNSWMCEVDTPGPDGHMYDGGNQWVGSLHTSFRFKPSYPSTDFINLDPCLAVANSKGFLDYKVVQNFKMLPGNFTCEAISDPHPAPNGWTSNTCPSSDQQIAVAHTIGGRPEEWTPSFNDKGQPIWKRIAASAWANLQAPWGSLDWWDGHTAHDGDHNNATPAGKTAHGAFEATWNCSTAGS